MARSKGPDSHAVTDSAAPEKRAKSVAAPATVGALRDATGWKTGREGYGEPQERLVERALFRRLKTDWRQS